MSEFLKNTAGQIVKGHVCNLTTGADETSGVAVAVVIDNGSAAAGSGTLTYKSGDLWHYLPTQAETNGDALSFIFSKAGAKTDTVDIYTTTKRVSALNDVSAADVNAQADQALSDIGLTTARAAKLDNLDTTVGSRLATSGYTAPTTPPTVTAIRQEMDANSTKLANLDAAVSTRLATSGYTAPTTPPTAAQVRQEIDFNSTQLAAIRSKTDGLPSDPADASDVAGAFSVVNGALGTLAGYVDTEVGSIKTVTDKINTALEQDGAAYRFTANALEQAPTGGGEVDVPTAGEIADAVLDEALSGHSTPGTAGAALATASTGGVDLNLLVDAILNASTADHSEEGTVGDALGVIKQAVALGAGYGTIEKTYTVTKNGLPLSDVTVKVRTVNDVAAAPYRWGVTDGSGEVVFRFPSSMAGSTVYLWREKGGERFYPVVDEEELPNE